MLQVTEKAAEYIKKSLEKRGKGIGIKLGVKTSGCSGLSYLLEFVDEINNENDYKIFESQGIKIFMDHKSAIYLDGTILDFEKEGLQEGFKFVNPNAKDECGCGKSFHI